MLDLWIMNEVLRLVNGMVLRLLKLLAMLFESGYDDRNAHCSLALELQDATDISETFLRDGTNSVDVDSPIIPHVTVIV
jgi:hypothetical protein